MSAPLCPQCGGRQLADRGRIPPGTVFAGHALQPPWDGGRLYRCRDCELGFRHPLRPQADYERLYELASSEVWVSNDAREDQRLVRELIADAAPQGSVLDVGCYDGALLAPLARRQAVFGIELSTLAAERARLNGVQIVGQRIGDLGGIDRHFDVITAVDVIEHVPDPRAFLELLASRLTPGGTLIVSTGNLDAAAWRLAGGGYWYCAIPEHIAFISPVWARKVAPGLGLSVRGLQTFRYRSDMAALRARAQRQFVLGVLASNLKDAVEPLLPASIAARRTRYAFGHPTLFADHIVVAFGKTA